MNEQVKENVQNETKAGNKKKWLLLVVLLAVVGAGLIWWLATRNVVVSGEARTVIKQLGKEETATIVLEEDIIVDDSIVVNGKKTIKGSGKIIMYSEADITWPESESDKKFAGTGCAAVEIQKTSEMPAVLVVSSGAELTLAGDVAVDATDTCNACSVEENGSLYLKDKATIENGRYCNVAVQEGATFILKDGSVLNGASYNVINHGDTSIEGGLVSGTEEKNGAGIYSTSALAMSDGTVEASKGYNVYIADGNFEMTGGLNSNATLDGVMAKGDATVSVTDGSIENCGKHGLHNDAEMTVGKVALADCGITNGSKGTMTVEGASVSGSYTFALANEGGTVKANGFNTEDCEAIAVCNLSGDMELSNLNLDGGRDGNVSVINGNVTIKDSVLGMCREKSVSISGGVVNIENIEVNGTTGDWNGIYVFGGELYLNGCNMKEIGSSGVRVDQAGYAEIANLTIEGTEATGVFGGGGTIIGENITMTDIAGHGVYNTGGEVTLSKVTLKNVAKNVIQQRAGTTVINNIDADKMDLGAYVQDGTLTINGGSFANSNTNGLRVIEGKAKLIVNNVTIENVAYHGISNAANVKATNVTIKNCGKNGVYTKTGATTTLKDSKVCYITEYGISNGKDATTKLENVTVSNTGKEKNAIQNDGVMTVNTVTVTASDKQGIYNSADLSGSGLTITDVGGNGIYNSTGKAKLSNVRISATGSQGINNKKATMSVDGLVIYNVPNNGIYNNESSEMTITGLQISSTGQHCINNDKTSTMQVANAELSDAGAKYNHLNNSGKFTGNAISLSGAAMRALYNTGEITVTKLTADGTEVTDKTCLVDNNKGTMTLSDSTVKNARGAGVYNVTGAKTTLNNVKIQNAVTYGIYSPVGTTVTGRDITITNVDQQAVYNAGNVEITNIAASKCQNGIITRGNGWITLSGNIKVTNMEKRAFVIWGDEGKGSVNGIKITSGSDVVIDTIGSHGIDNKGAFLMAEDTTLEVKNVSGSGTNAIYNYNDKTVAAVMTLGTVKISGISVEATATVQGNAIANRGDLTLAGDVTVSGIHASGKNMSSNKNFTGLMNYNGTVKGNANIKVLGETTEKDGNVNVNADTVLCGVYAEGEASDILVGNITVSNVRGQGIQVNAGTLTAKDIVVDTSAGGRGIYMNNAKCTINASGKVDVKNIASKNGIETNSGTLNADEVVVANVGACGISSTGTTSITKSISVANVTGKGGLHVKGTLTVGENVTIDSVSGKIASDDQGNGVIVENGANVQIGGDLKIKDVTTTVAEGTEAKTSSNNGIFSKGTVTVNKNLEMDNVKTGYGIFCNANSLTVNGNTTIKNVTAKNVILVKSGSSVTLNGGKIEGKLSDGVVMADGAGVKVTVKNLTIENSGAAKYGLYCKNSAEMIAENVTTDGCGANIQSSGKATFAGNCNFKNFSDRGIYMDNKAELTLADGAVVSIIHEGDGSTSSGINMTNTTTITGEKATINIQDIKNTGIYMANTVNFTVGTVTVSDISGDSGHGIRLNGCTPNIKIGSLTINNCAQYAMTSNSAIDDKEKLFISALTVSDCKDDNKLNNIGANCYQMTPETTE